MPAPKLAARRSRRAARLDSWANARKIELRNVSHAYPDPSSSATDSGFAVRDLSLEIAPGESMALLGPSGCGKTTLLRLIAGLERPLEGTITLGDETVCALGKQSGSLSRNGSGGRAGVWVAPENRKVGMVFQDWALFPHLTAGRNVGYGLARADRAPERIVQALDLVGLGGFADRLPGTLSGGQQQRVALARALAPRPGILLLDEPFSNLDASLRTSVRSEVRNLLKTLGVTAVFVTHDQDEAFVLGDRVGVLHEGRLAQADTPDAIYRRPLNRFVAGFVGMASWLRCPVADATAHTPLGRLPVVSDNHAESTPRLNGSAQEMDVLLRPEQLQLAPGSTAQVQAVEFYGHDSLVTANLDGTQLQVRCGPDPAVRPGDTTDVTFVGTKVVAFPPAD